MGVAAQKVNQNLPNLGFGQPIPRLYVAGELGSFWGFIYQGCGNNAEALIFGRIAGEEASKEKRWS